MHFLKRSVYIPRPFKQERETIARARACPTRGRHTKNTCNLPPPPHPSSIPSSSPLPLFLSSPYFTPFITFLPLPLPGPPLPSLTFPFPPTPPTNRPPSLPFPPTYLSSPLTSNPSPHAPASSKPNILPLPLSLPSPATFHSSPFPLLPLPCLSPWAYPALFAVALRSLSLARPDTVAAVRKVL